MSLSAIFLAPRFSTMPFDALKFSLLNFFVLFVLGIFAPTYRANAQLQSGQARKPPARQSPPAKRGLDFSVGPRGLDSLSYDGQSLLRSNRNWPISTPRKI